MDVNIAMKLLSQKILFTIKENYIEAINKLSTESFDVYGFINDEFKNTEDITKNHLFQFVFRSFYRLDNAGLTQEFKTRYFQLKDKNEKIDKYLEQYSYITSTVQELLLNDEINCILNSLNNSFGESSTKMGEVKKLDTLMWGVGKVLKDKNNLFEEK